MKKLLQSHYLKLCTAMVIFVNPIISKQVTKQPNVPARVKPVTPVKPILQPIQPITPTPAPKISTGHTKNDPEILDINKSVKVINYQGDCNANKWNNNPDETCQCCLTYGEGRFGEEQTADQIIDHCTNKSKQCTTSSIANIKKKYNAQHMTNDDFLDTLYSKTTVVHKMAISPTQLGANSTLTENGLADILTQAYAEGKLQDQDFKNSSCLKIKKSGSVAGYNTVQLFRVTSTCTPSKEFSYIVKESKKGLEESTNLKKIQNYPGMKDIIAPNIVAGFPSIALPFFYFSYHPHNQNIHYIATMPAAKGIVLYDLLMKFRDNQTQENEERMKKAYYILGKELSNFHKKFMKPTPGKKLGKTIAHGDFHPHNIFYDEQGGHCTFIDNETMVRCFGNLQEPAIDFRRLLFTPFTTNNTVLQFKELLKGVKANTYLNITLKPFINGYISAYQPHERKQLLRDLKEIFTTTTSLSPWKLDAQYMNQLMKNEIIPIFNEIEKTLTK